LPFECKKIAQNFFYKVAKNLKKNQTLATFGKKWQVFGNILTFKWQFSGGSADRGDLAR